MLHLLRRPKASRARSVAAAVAAAAARYPAECDKIMASLGLWREPAKRASRKLDLPHVVAPGKGAIAHMSASNGVRRQLYDALAAQVDIDGLSFGTRSLIATCPENYYCYSDVPLQLLISDIYFPRARRVFRIGYGPILGHVHENQILAVLIRMLSIFNIRPLPLSGSARRQAHDPRPAAGQPVSL